MTQVFEDLSLFWQAAVIIGVVGMVAIAMSVTLLLLVFLASGNKDDSRFIDDMSHRERCVLKSLQLSALESITRDCIETLTIIRNKMNSGSPLGIKHVIRIDQIESRWHDYNGAHEEAMSTTHDDYQEQISRMQ